eukprot:GFUD01036378.1.p1 GENE.GFUD01036378.1~~GFUD01036378.1.p1  ORF type:complete len:1011 (-),score=265.43 GFUD01036378.1:60-3092(-)
MEKMTVRDEKHIFWEQFLYFRRHEENMVEIVSSAPNNGFKGGNMSGNRLWKKPCYVLTSQVTGTTSDNSKASTASTVSTEQNMFKPTNHIYKSTEQQKFISTHIPCKRKEENMCQPPKPHKQRHFQPPNPHNTSKESVFHPPHISQNTTVESILDPSILFQNATKFHSPILSQNTTDECILHPPILSQNTTEQTTLLLSNLSQNTTGQNVFQALHQNQNTTEQNMSLSPYHSSISPPPLTTQHHSSPLLYQLLMLHKLNQQNNQSGFSSSKTFCDHTKDEDVLPECHKDELTEPLDLSMKTNGSRVDISTLSNEDTTNDLNDTSMVSSYSFDEESMKSNEEFEIISFENSSSISSKSTLNQNEQNYTEPENGLHLLSDCAEMVNINGGECIEREQNCVAGTVEEDIAEFISRKIKQYSCKKNRRRPKNFVEHFNSASFEVKIKMKMSKLQNKYFKISRKVKRLASIKDRLAQRNELKYTSSDGEQEAMKKEGDVRMLQDTYAQKSILSMLTSNLQSISNEGIVDKMNEKGTSKRKNRKTSNNDNEIVSKFEEKNQNRHQNQKEEEEFKNLFIDLQTNMTKSYRGFCTLTEDVLKDDLRVLLRLGGLFYPGRVTCILPPDIYGVLVDKERGNRPHVFSREEVISQAIHDRRPLTVSELTPGDRVCAYWSSKMNYLHPGTVAGPDVDEDYVIIQLDDGDSRDIHIDQVRYLPENYPLVVPDQNSITGLFGSRKRDSSSQIQETNEKKRKTSTNSTKSKKHTKNKCKKKNTECEWSVSVTEVSDNCESKSDTIALNELPSDDSPERDDDQDSAFVSNGHRDDSDLDDQDMESLPDRRISGSDKSAIAAFLPPQHLLWSWSDEGRKLSAKARKVYHDSIEKDDDTIRVGDCAVFLSTGRPDRPYIGRIHSMWQTSAGNMKVQVNWFYHPAEVEGIAVGGGRVEDIKTKGALYESCHFDENDIQTVSHKCHILELDQFKQRLQTGEDPTTCELYYLAGEYDPVEGVIVFRQGVCM